MSDTNNIHILSSKEFYAKIYNKEKSEYVTFIAYEDKDDDVDLHIYIGSGPDEKEAKFSVSKTDKDFLYFKLQQLANFVRGY